MDRITELELELQKLKKEEFEKKREEFSKFIGKSFRVRLKWNDEYRYVRIIDITNITEVDIVVEGVMVDFTRKGQKIDFNYGESISPEIIEEFLIPNEEFDIAFNECLECLKKKYNIKEQRKATFEELRSYFDKKSAIELIKEERDRQIEKGYDSERDKNYSLGELANAASCYAMIPSLRPAELPPFPWPWMEGWNPNPDNRIKELTKAGALIVAEIERLQKLEQNG